MPSQFTRAHHQKFLNVIIGYVVESLPKFTLSLFMKRGVGALEGVGLNGSDPNLLNLFGGGLNLFGDGLNLFGDELNSRGGELNSLKKSRSVFCISHQCLTLREVLRILARNLGRESLRAKSRVQSSCE